MRLRNYKHVPDALNFNPRTPYGMRPNFDDDDVVFHKISIHAPLTGCDSSRL